ncbi:VOC family protein [Kitasatospora sp. A2-31]|uniref:VOC family protein n=1 Tax=Kitasatospora sp. A2-31 TaxID=2916414 RepID=UPI001EE8A622|nr:VOC family protein [Kitasatospora sp. A2-31]MCG6493115.1 VOC family protein [Kitasatospora sp. A2-31]
MLTTDFPAGSPCWIDLGSPDPAAAATFYGAVFGWTFQDLGPEAGGYGFLQAAGKTVAAVGPLTEEGAQSAWTTYFRTPDADATAAAVEKAGGTVRVAPFDVMEAGRMGQLTDPQGAQFAIWQAGTTTGLDAVSTDNALVWAELHTPDPEAGFAFYRQVFGWRSEKFPAPGMTYLVVSPAEGDQRATTFGGIAPVMAEGQPPSWTPYFATEVVDELVGRAQAAGGRVLMAAEDVPNVGRIAWLADPFGAPFALIKGEPQDS